MKLYLRGIAWALAQVLWALAGNPEWDRQTWPHCNNQNQCWAQARRAELGWHWSWCRCRCLWCLIGRRRGTMHAADRQ